MDYKQILFPVVLFLVAFYVWTLPVSELPFGEGDAAWHFGIGDYISATDKTIDRLPTYVGYWYYLFNPKIGPLALEYPPSNHINYALMQVVGGERVIPVYLYKAITSFLGIFAVYFLISRLYGSIPAFAAGLGLAFSSREILTYLWGQQPTLISITIIPVFLYALYKLETSVYEGKPKIIYLYATVLLMASQFLLHIQGLFVSIVIGVIFKVLMFLKHRRIPFKAVFNKNNFIHGGICLAILAVVILPFMNIYLGPESDIAERGSFGRLFSWTIDSSLQQGAYPDAYFSFSNNYSLFLLPFIILGIVFIALRRKEQDLLMLSWLAGIYIVLHLDVLIGASIVRVARMLVAEPQLFFALAAIGAFYAQSLIKLPSPARDYAKLSLVGLLGTIIVATIGVSAMNDLGKSYQGISRVTNAQVEAAKWLDENTPRDAAVFNAGTLTYPKMRFMHVLSRRYTSNKPSGFQLQGAGKYPGLNLTPSYYVFDYSDLSQLRGDTQIEKQIAQLSELESQVNATKVYDRNSIRIYSIKNG